jgi:hypothetical protein
VGRGSGNVRRTPVVQQYNGRAAWNTARPGFLNKNGTEANVEKKKFTAFEWFVVLAWFAAWIIAVCSGCDANGEGDDMSMFRGMNMGNVGGIGIALPAANAPALSKAGMGPIIQLVKFVGVVRAPDGQRALEAPKMLTAAVSVRSGTGPIVGRAVWSSGNGSPNVVYFDVPTKLVDDTSPYFGQSDSVLISVPADVLEIDAQNNANLFANSDAAVPLGNSNVAAVANANVADGPRGGGAPITLTAFGAYNPGGAGTAVASIPVPPMAKSFRVFRNDPADTMSVDIRNFFTAAPLDGPYVIAAGAPSPEFQLPGNAGLVVLTPSVAATKYGCIFTLGL